MKNIGWDTETHLIGAPYDIIPPIVCASWDVAQQGSQSPESTAVKSTGDGTDLWDWNLRMWQSAYEASSRIVIHNAAFDVNVGLRMCLDVQNGHRPGRCGQARDLYFLIWDVLEKSMDNEWSGSGPILVSDTLIREKLLHLSSHGSMTFRRGQNIRYSLADVVKRHFKVDISGDKVSTDKDGRVYDAEGNDITGTPEAGASWRLRYKELDGIPSNEWPEEAWDYAWSDSYWARLVWEAQDKRIDHRPEATHGTARSESLQVYSSIALYMCTANGFTVDQGQVGRLSQSVIDQLDRIEDPLRNNGIIRANGSVNTKIVKERIENVWSYLERQPLLTPSGDIATSKEVMEIICEAGYDEALELYAMRQGLAKLRDAFLPNLQGDRVYTNFDTIKETGRTSSFGSSTKKGKKPLYAAVNSQQMPRKVGVRECFMATDPNYYLVSVDYSALELCSVAQVTFNLFGHSVHRDKINAGYDLHAYLGSAIAMVKEPSIVGHANNVDDSYQVLAAHRKYRPPRDYFERGVTDSEVEDRLHLAKRAKHFRNLAKPVGLGYPGGLAEKTMSVFAKTVYRVLIEEHEAAELKDLWLHIYPEMVDYFQWVRGSRDFRNQNDDGDYKYCYTTPGFRRFRAGATYCATSNGMSMQSLSADGAKRSVCWIARACAGALPQGNPFRILDACYHQTFIHDEHIVALPPDPLVTERAMAIAQLMTHAMSIHMPDVHLSAEPALMRRWRKSAEAEWEPDVGGSLQALGYARQQYPDIDTQNIRQFGSPEGRLVAYEDIYGEGIDELY